MLAGDALLTNLDPICLGKNRVTKILVAEDESEIRDLISFTLELSGYQVIEAANGQEAFNLAQQDPPDLVLLDVRMPFMTGYETCAAMKSEKKLRNVPIMFLSAKGQDYEIQMGYQAGAQEYLVKPFSPELLIKRIKVLLTGSKKK
jgi:DNA-binding response OmpR family regulator